MKALAAAVAGLLFGAGLVLSGMTDPHKVLGFLDIFGAWDASLMLVMVGAIGVHALGYRWVRARRAPLFAAAFDVPARRDIDAKLLFGAVLFGVGWGLSGYCPGPSLVSLAALGHGTIVFVIALAFGSFLTGRAEAAASRNVHTDSQPSAAE